MIEVVQTGHADPLAFKVTVVGEPRQQSYDVSISRADLRRLTGGNCEPELLIKAAFRFLLDREPQEAIMSSFNVTVISSYFPEFEKELPHYLAEVGADSSQ